MEVIEYIIGAIASMEATSNKHEKALVGIALCLQHGVSSPSSPLAD